MSISADAENFAVCDHTRRFAFCRLNARRRAAISVRQAITFSKRSPTIR